MGRLPWLTTKTLVLACGLALTACPGEGGDTGPSVAGTESSSSASAASALAAFTEDPCPLFPESLLRAEVPEAPAEVEHGTGTKAYRQCSYTWSGPRKASREIAGRTIEYPLNDTVSLHALRVLEVEDPLARFKTSYRTMTDEEQAQTQAAIARGMDRQAAEGKLSEQGARVGKDLAAGFLSKQQYETVEGVGTAAAWGGTGRPHGLRVLDQDTEFELLVDVHADDAQNRDVAIRIAKQILANAR